MPVRRGDPESAGVNRYRRLSASEVMLWDAENGRIEIPLVVAETIAEDVDAAVAMIEVTPTFERMEVTVVWLNEKGV